MSQEIFNIIETCVIIPILTALTGIIIAFLNKQTQRLKNKFANEQTAHYLDIANNIVIQAVTCVSQTYVEALKKEDKFDKEAQKEAFEKAKTLVYALMKTECKKAVEEYYIDFDKWLITKIEEQVNNAK